MGNILDNAIKETIILGDNDKNKKRFHIAMTGTPDYIPRLGVVMGSILQSNVTMSFIFHFFLEYIPDAELEKLQAIVKKTDSLIYIHLMDNQVFTPLIFGKKTAVFFYRFVVSEVVGDLSDRILYLDGDTICRGSIKKLEEIDLKDYLGAVVSDRREHRSMTHLNTSRFFNAGMMLIHTSQWKKEGIFDKVVELAISELKYIDEKGKHKLWQGESYNDQNILNVLLDQRLLFLPKKYNYIFWLGVASPFKNHFRNENYKEQIILHFAGNVKPWSSWVQELPVVQEYASFQRNTPWKDTSLKEPEGYKDFHQAARMAIKYKHWKQALVFYGRYILAKI